MTKICFNVRITKATHADCFIHSWLTIKIYVLWISWWPWIHLPLICVYRRTVWKTSNMKTLFLCVFVYSAHLIPGVDMTTSDQTNRQLTTVPSRLSSYTTILKLSNNLLRGLDANSFRNYPNLEKLYVGCNIIEVIQDGTFDHQTQLVQLNLSYNKIRQLPASFGPSTTKLLELEMYASYTTITIFRFPYFAAFTRLFHLALGGHSEKFEDLSILPSSLYSLNVLICILPTLPDLSYIPNIRFLNIVYAAIEKIPQQHTKTNTKLVWLQLIGNKLTSTASFSHMSLLKTILLGEICWRKFPVTTFQVWLVWRHLNWN